MIKENLKKILEELPEGVDLVGAAKTRTPDEVLEAIDAGLKIIGENYVQEAEKAFEAVGAKVRWHLIETVDSMKLARAIDKACQNMGKVMQVLIEVNSGEEPQKAGVMPEDGISLVRDMSELKNIKIMGLMTMGPFAGDPEDARPYFHKTRKLFEEIKALNLPGVEMKYLSMGMSNSYRVALEEGANMVRIGTKLFGERVY
jgi:pyridoxal phosphate enzyme (YggS family)